MISNNNKYYQLKWLKLTYNYQKVLKILNQQKLIKTINNTIKILTVILFSIRIIIIMMK